jgi:hypothetical protein
MAETSVKENENPPLEVATANGGEPEQPEPEPVQGRRRTWFLLGGISLVALCIALPIGLVQKRDNENDKERYTAPS